jgi:hypothetical protein
MLRANRIITALAAFVFLCACSSPEVPGPSTGSGVASAEGTARGPTGILPEFYQFLSEILPSETQDKDCYYKP